MALSTTRRGLLAVAAASPFGLATTPGRTAASGPSLFFTPERVERARSLRRGELAAAWRGLRATTQAAHRVGPVKFREGGADRERGWQRDVGNSMATLAAAFLLEGEAADRDLAIALAMEASGYPVWGEDRLDGADLAAGHMMVGIATVLDWLGDEMEPATRSTLLATLRRRGAQMSAAATGGGGTKPAYWAKSWMQNHLWISMTGLLAAGLALREDDAAAAAEMVGTASERMTRVFAALPPDGSSQEGPGYWDYGAAYLLKFHHLATENLGITLDGTWLREAAAYRAAMALPEASWTSRLSMLDPADSPRSPWYGPETMLRRLAALNRDGAAQSLAGRLEKAGAVHANAPWLNFVWFDPSVRPESPPEAPALRHFRDLDLVVARSDHSGREAVVLMRAGPPLGHRAQSERYPYDVGTGHVHPDVNHVTLFGGGGFLLKDDGYSGTKETAHHNTLLVDGIGQTGSGKEWTRFPSYPIPDPQPTIAVIETGPGFDYWVGEGVAAYPAATRLRRFDRHVLFVKPDILVVVDDLEAEASTDFTLLWHPGEAAVPEGKDRYLVALDRTVLSISLVLPNTARHETAQRSTTTHDRKAASMDEIAVVVSGPAAQCGALFAWGAKSVPTSLTHDAGVWTLQAPGRSIRVLVRERRIAA